MRRLRGWFLLCVAALWWASGALPLAAQTPAFEPRISPRLPVPFLPAPFRQAPPSAPRPQSLPPLRAVLLVGLIDNADASDANSARQRQDMDLAAAKLATNGVAVSKFYSPSADWNLIKAAANGANFLFYRGHGVYWPPPDMPSPVVGGFYLSNRVNGVAQTYMKSSANIVADLHLAPNAIVMLGSACFSAGTSANDSISINSAEAQKRVAMYAHPFLDIGAAGYFADWYDTFMPSYLDDLFAGYTLGEAYQRFFDYHSSTAELYTYPGPSNPAPAPGMGPYADHTANVMWLDKDGSTNNWQYNDAFVGRPNERLTDLFDSTRMAVSPGLWTYVTAPAGPPRTRPIHVECNTSAVFTWTATLVDGAPWLSLSGPLSGQSGTDLTATVDPAGQTNGVRRGHVRLTTTTPNIGGADQTVTVTLSVLTNPREVYAPILDQN
jgi:hypothetical protein